MSATSPGSGPLAALKLSSAQAKAHSDSVAATKPIKPAAAFALSIMRLPPIASDVSRRSVLQPARLERRLVRVCALRQVRPHHGLLLAGLRHMVRALGPGRIV